MLRATIRGSAWAIPEFLAIRLRTAGCASDIQLGGIPKMVIDVLVVGLGHVGLPLAREASS